jgi:hypothetical protein
MVSKAATGTSLRTEEAVGEAVGSACVDLVIIGTGSRKSLSAVS